MNSLIESGAVSATRLPMMKRPHFKRVRSRIGLLTKAPVPSSPQKLPRIGILNRVETRSIHNIPELIDAITKQVIVEVVDVAYFENEDLLIEIAN